MASAINNTPEQVTWQQSSSNCRSQMGLHVSSDRVWQSFYIKRPPHQVARISAPWLAQNRHNNPAISIKHGRVAVHSESLVLRYTVMHPALHFLFQVKLPGSSFCETLPAYSVFKHIRPHGGFQKCINKNNHGKANNHRGAFLRPFMLIRVWLNGCTTSMTSNISRWRKIVG